MSGIIPDGLDALGNNPFQVIIVITYKWDTDDNISSSGAKLYIRTHPAGRNFALARDATLVGGLRASEARLGHCQDNSHQNGTDQAGT